MYLFLYSLKPKIAAPLFGLICWGNWGYPANEAEGGHLEGFECMCSWHVETLVWPTMHCSKLRGCILRVSFSKVKTIIPTFCWCMKLTELNWTELTKNLRLHKFNKKPNFSNVNIALNVASQHYRQSATVPPIIMLSRKTFSALTRLVPNILLIIF